MLLKMNLSITDILNQTMYSQLNSELKLETTFTLQFQANKVTHLSLANVIINMA